MPTPPSPKSRAPARAATDPTHAPRELLLGSRAWLDYARRVYALDPGGYPFYSYVGLNFTGTAIKNYKFYFAFHRRLTPAELDVVLPVENRGYFDRFYEQWHPSKETKTVHRGTTFALKVEADGTLTHYYHLRVQGLPFGPPARLQLTDYDRYNYHGVCEEFTGGKAHLKRYFYCRDKLTIAESLKVGGMPNRALAVDWLEYIESDGRDKLTWVSRDLRLASELIVKRGPPELQQVLASICDDCGFVLYAPGSARDGRDHSIYFVQPEGDTWLDGVRTFALRHLGLRSFTPKR
jgi:hypothetical protein